MTCPEPRLARTVHAGPLPGRQLGCYRVVVVEHPLELAQLDAVPLQRYRSPVLTMGADKLPGDRARLGRLVSEPLHVPGGGALDECDLARFEWLLPRADAVRRWRQAEPRVV